MKVLFIHIWQLKSFDERPQYFLCQKQWKTPVFPVLEAKKGVVQVYYLLPPCYLSRQRFQSNISQTCRTQSNSETNISLKRYNQVRTAVIMILLNGIWTILYSPGRKSRRNLIVPQLPELKKTTNYIRALLSLLSIATRPVIVTQVETLHSMMCPVTL